MEQFLSHFCEIIGAIVLIIFTIICLIAGSEFVKTLFVKLCDAREDRKWKTKRVSIKFDKDEYERLERYWNSTHGYAKFDIECLVKVAVQNYIER